MVQKKRKKMAYSWENLDEHLVKLDFGGGRKHRLKRFGNLGAGWIVHRSATALCSRGLFDLVCLFLEQGH